MKKNFSNSYLLSADKFARDKILSAPIIKTIKCHENQPTMILCHCDHVRNQFSFFILSLAPLRIDCDVLIGLCVMTLKHIFK